MSLDLNDTNKPALGILSNRACRIEGTHPTRPSTGKHLVTKKLKKKAVWLVHLR